jgi:hypothetical protein
MGGFISSYKEMQALNRRALRSHVETTLKRDDDSPIRLVDTSE